MIGYVDTAYWIWRWRQPFDGMPASGCTISMLPVHLRSIN